MAQEASRVQQAAAMKTENAKRKRHFSLIIITLIFAATDARFLFEAAMPARLTGLFAIRCRRFIFAAARLMPPPQSFFIIAAAIFFDIFFRLRFTGDIYSFRNRVFSTG
jgi:hypothetical protein